MDPSEPLWRTNSSFSPPLSRRSDCRFVSDGSSHIVHEAPTYESSVSFRSKDSTAILNANQYLNHQHSSSDGALVYLESPSDNFQTTQWTPPVQRFDHGEFSTPLGGARPRSSEFSKFNERRFEMGSSFYSPSPLSESRRWPSFSKQPIFFPRNLSGRRSFMSKPVYPLVIRNPVSNDDALGNPETSTGGRMSPDDGSKTSPWSERNWSPEVRFHRALTELQKMRASPDLNASSRRDGFRWSNGSSYDFGLDEIVDFPDNISIESQAHLNNSARCQKCGLCERWLWQKSPWSSNQMVRNADMPIAGVLYCCHVFHADCLEEATPKNQIHDPPCPLCLKATYDRKSASFSEPLQLALRSIRRGQMFNTMSSVAGCSSNVISHHGDGTLRHSHSVLNAWKGSSSFKKHLRKPFSFKGNLGKDLFKAKLFKKSASSSSLVPGKPESNKTKKN